MFTPERSIDVANTQNDLPLAKWGYEHSIAAAPIDARRSASSESPIEGSSTQTSGPADNWGDLMHAAQKGNAGAYTRLLGEVDVWLKRYYARRLPPSIVDDAAQDTLLVIHVRRHTYEPGRPFKAWLSGIARYKWIDYLRTLERNPAAPCAEGLIEEIASEDDHGTAIASAAVLGNMLARLRPAQAEVIRLVKLDGYSIEQASRRTGQSESLVKVNIHRGLAKLGAMAGAGYA